MKPLRLTKIIKQLLNKRSAKGLMEEIARANGKAKTGCTISYKTLDKIANFPARVQLKWEHLVALDTYFGPLGEGLDEQPILEKLGILTCLASPRKTVNFLLGAKPRPKARRCDLSPWDTRSSTHIVRELGRFNRDAPHEIIDVILGPHRHEATLVNEEWFKLLGQTNSGIIAIGAPRANLASEVALTRMFNLKPFAMASLEPDQAARLPFHFIWPPGDSRNYRSRFALPAKQIPDTHRAVRKAVLANKAAAFRLGADYYLVPKKQNEWTVHGIIAAQRRANGQVWLVISGLTGPATYAAAMKVSDISDSLPWVPNQDGPVLWAAVEATVREVRRGLSRGDDREVVNARILGKAQIWPPRLAPAKARNGTRQGS